MKKTEEEKNSKFVKMWGATINQGRNKFIIIRSSIFVVTLIIIEIVTNLYKGEDFDFGLVAAISIGGIIGSALVWSTNEKKYNNIVDKQRRKRYHD